MYVYMYVCMYVCMYIHIYSIVILVISYVRLWKLKRLWGPRFWCCAFLFKGSKGFRGQGVLGLGDKQGVVSLFGAQGL